jgi:Rrf2 family protein
MKLQISTSLALYSVLEVAAGPERQISAAEIAGKYDISMHHLAKVLRELVRAGMIESTRGVGGGYRFAGNAKRVTLMDVIELFEGVGDGARRREPGAATDAGRAIGVVLAEIDETAQATFRSITIDTLLKLIERRRAAAERKPADAPKRSRRR